MKQYNGLVQLEVKRLAGPSEMEYVKRQAGFYPRLLPHSVVPVAVA